jgi:hypothetical protein
VRSHLGAKFAVRIAVRLLGDFAAKHCHPDHLPAIGQLAGEQLPRTVARAWRADVLTHIESTPFSQAELEHLARHNLPAHRLLNDPVAAYGATLLAAILTPAYILYLQIGDGDMLVVGLAGEQVSVSRPPLPSDPRLFADQTTSLSSTSAWQEFRIHYQPLVGRPPVLVMLASDGYANSFATESDFLRVPVDLFLSMQRLGAPKTMRMLRGWLRRTSVAGSGDDITAGLAWRPMARSAP